MKRIIDCRSLRQEQRTGLNFPINVGLPADPRGGACAHDARDPVGIGQRRLADVSLVILPSRPRRRFPLLWVLRLTTCCCCGILKAFKVPVFLHASFVRWSEHARLSDAAVVAGTTTHCLIPRVCKFSRRQDTLLWISSTDPPLLLPTQYHAPQWPSCWCQVDYNPGLMPIV